MFIQVFHISMSFLSVYSTPPSFQHECLMLTHIIEVMERKL